MNHNLRIGRSFLTGLLLLLPVVLVCLLTNFPVFAAATTPEQAQAAVTGWLKLGNAPLGTALGQQVKEVKTFKDEGGATLYYIVNLQPSGFVVVSADDLIEPIIAFVATGAYDPSPSNPLAALVGQDQKGRMAAAKAAAAPAGGVAGRAVAANATQKKWASFVTQANVDAAIRALSDMRVAPLVQSLWNQKTAPGGQACYNYYTPGYGTGDPRNYWCGCVATAMAQVMRYHRYPTLGIGQWRCPITVDNVAYTMYTIGGNGVGGPYDWANMPLVPDASTSVTQCQAIGALCLDAGLTVEMNYTASGSGAFISEDAKWDSTNALVSVFKYGNAVAGLPAYMSQFYDMVNPNLDCGCPVLLQIAGTTNGKPEGHAIVCDGCGYNANASYHHLNLGWAGNDNAWYNLPTIETSQGTFTSVTGCAYNIFPTGTGEIISGRVLDTSGNPVSGAVVSIANTSATLTTPATGIYAFRGFSSAATYTLSAAKGGYIFRSITVTTGTSTNNSQETGNRWNQDIVPDNPPTITSGPSVTPGSPIAWQAASFSVVASDPDNDPMTASWDFGDGSTGGDWAPTHTYSAGGTYTVTVTVSDGYGGVDAKSTTVTVIAVKTVQATKKKFALNFKTGRDSLDITFLDQGFIYLNKTAFTAATQNQVITVQLGGALLDSATLFKGHGTGTLNSGKFTWTARTGLIRYTATRLTLQNVLEPYGAVNATTFATISVPILLGFGGQWYGGTYPFTYSAKQGKTAKGQ